jgi:two-component system nitrogen regulation sensor histidine kinase NtrY
MADWANEDLRAINVELDRRRSHMETVIENIAAGIIPDRNGLVTAVNKATTDLLEVWTVLSPSKGWGYFYQHSL